MKDTEFSAMKEYNGKMYNNYIYQIIVESK